MMEQFIPGFEGKYSVDIYGNVYSYLRKIWYPYLLENENTTSGGRKGNNVKKFE